MRLVKHVRLICAALLRPFARSAAVKSGMGPASEGNPTGYFH